MGAGLSTLAGALALFGLAGLAMAADATQAGSMFFKADGSFNTLALAATIAAGLLLVALIQKLRQPKNLPPLVPYTIPYVGNILQLANPVDSMMDAHKKHGEIWRFHVMGRDWVFLESPDAHKAFFESSEDDLCAREAYGFTIPVFGKGVVYDTDASMLLQHRKFAASGLTIKQFRSYTDIIRRETEDFINKHWGEKGECELLESLNEITLYTSTHCIQGPEVRSRFNKEFAALYTDLDKALGVVSFLFPGLPVPVHTRRDKARQTIEKLYQEIIDKRRTDGKTEYSDLIHTLMTSTYPDGSHLPDEEVIGLCIAALLAGQHTSNVTSTWLGCYLLENPHILDKVVAEHDEIFPPSEEFTLDFEKWKKLDFLQNCLKETLRMRPPIIMVFRRAMIDWKFKDFVVPAGSNVIVSPALSNRDPEVFSNPNEFDPDRFSKERAEEKKVKYSYIPFSAGRHACIGEQFAVLQVSAIWSTILHHYKVELVSKNIEPDYTTMIVAPKPPVTIRYTRRH